MTVMLAMGDPAMVGRLIHEIGCSAPWEGEVVAMLEEDRSSVFGGTDALGANIVGGSLEQVKDLGPKSCSVSSQC